MSDGGGDLAVQSRIVAGDAVVAQAMDIRKAASHECMKLNVNRLFEQRQLMDHDLISTTNQHTRGSSLSSYLPQSGSLTTTIW